MGLVKKDHEDVYKYNPSTGNVEYYSVKNSFINWLLNGIRNDYKNTMKVEEDSVSVFFIMSSVDLLYLLCVVGLGILIGGCGDIFILVGIGVVLLFTTLSLCQRPFLFLSIILNFIFLIVVTYWVIPTRMEYHYKKCKDAQYAVAHGHRFYKNSDMVTCLYENYFITHSEELREKFNVEKNKM